MALKKIVMEDFLGKNVTHSFYHKNKIVGANGAGKTSIKEAICFLFNGTDSSGSRNPQHLISKDKDSCKVVVVTDKAEISRTLTRKGNGTLKLSRNGVSQSLSQEEMESMVASADLFLSVFIPGYFLRLKTEKQHKIISEISPKVDRIELVEKISGLQISKEMRLRYNFDRRADLVASAIASDRRDLERQSAMKAGEIKQLQSLQPLPKPECPDNIEAEIANLESLKRAWELYETDLRSYNNLAARYDRIKLENEMKETKRKQLKENIASVIMLTVPELPSTVKEVQALRETKKSLPEKPAISQVVEADNCPTCGQTVGVKHRERVRERNEQLISEYNKALEEVNSFNKGVEDKASQMLAEFEKKVAERNEVIAKNNKLQSTLKGYEIELAGMVDQELPEIPSKKPESPAEVFEIATLDTLQRKKREYDSQVSKYNFVQEQIKDAAFKIESITKEIQTIEASSSELKQIEDAVKQIPQEELKLQMKAFEMETVKIEVGEKIQVTKDGILYDYLSTGQAAKADLELCRKINSLMKRPISMVFLDNADLVDHLEWGDTQMFAAYVDKSVEAVEIQEIV